MAQLKLIAFKSMTCFACRAMDRAKTLEKFAEKHPEVFVGQVVLPDSEPATASAKEADELGDKFKVKSLPTLIFFRDADGAEWDGGGTVLLKQAGAVNATELEKLFEKADRKFAKLEDEDEEEADDADEDEDDTDEDD